MKYAYRIFFILLSFGHFLLSFPPKGGFLCPKPRPIRRSQVRGCVPFSVQHRQAGQRQRAGLCQKLCASWSDCAFSSSAADALS